jgi:P4 family phage/plasmid primase-like protien
MYIKSIPFFLRFSLKKMKTFSKKQNCLDSLPSGYIVGNSNIKNYFHVKSHADYLVLIKSKKSPCYYEYIDEKQPVKLFFDIEIYDGHYLFDTPNVAVDLVKSVWGDQYILLESHGLSGDSLKKSFHMIYPSIHFKNVLEIKYILQNCTPFVEFINDKIIDMSVYRTGLFRTVLSSKKNENRPLVLSSDSPMDSTDLLDTFITFSLSWDFTPVIKTTTLELTSEITPQPTEQTSTSHTQHDIQVIHLFVRKHYNYPKDKIQDVKVYHEKIIIALKDKFCRNIDREHKSNHQYIVIDNNSSRQKCHDPDCSKFQSNIISAELFGKDVLSILSPPKLDIENNFSLVTPRMLQDGKNDGKQLMDDIWNDKDVKLNYDKILQMFHAKAGKVVSSFFPKGGCKDGCKPQHCIVSDGFFIKCNVCNHTFPNTIATPEKYLGLHKFFLTINNTININSHNGNINGNGNTIGSGSVIEDFNCQIDIDPSIFNDETKTELMNQILSGHKEGKLSELLSTIEEDFVYCDKKWWIFTGSIWCVDVEAIDLHFKTTSLAKEFDTIIKFYKANPNNDILNNVTKLVERLHKHGFQSEIIKSSKYYFKDNIFISKLDSNKHLVAFTNGVYDLNKKVFRNTLKTDYTSMTVGYDYKPDVCNKEVHKFINSILPHKPVRDYVLKKMAEALNPHIQNTNLLLFLGNGANGKSQLFNLMSLTFGQYAGVLPSTILTRKKADPGNASPELMELEKKRFACVSEPPQGEHLNVSTIKEFTGSEQITGRKLYHGPVCFTFDAKIFIGCNQLPDLKGEDEAIWRRLRVVEFPNKFVHEPTRPNEFMIDGEITSKMNDGNIWRQTFLNILLDYYYQDVPEPEEVTVKTKEYAQDNNEYESWFKDHIVEKEGSILNLKDLAMKFYDTEEKIHPRDSSKVRIEFEKFIKNTYPNMQYKCKKSQIVLVGEKVRYNGWIGLNLE